MARLVYLVMLLCQLAAIFATSENSAADLAHGFGDDINWVEWPSAISIALDVNKPIFLLIHKTWCGACKALKNSLSTSSKRKEFVELSKKFVMANTEDDDEPEDEEYAPDGRYIPRLFFLNKHGKRLEVDNKKNYATNAHYFPQTADVIRGMKQALKAYETLEASSPDEPVKLPNNKDQKKGKKNDEKEFSNIVETPEEESLGEMHISEEQLAFMESGGCPHAAAARAAMQAAEEIVEKNEQDDNKQDKENKQIQKMDKKSQDKQNKDENENSKQKKFKKEEQKKEKATKDVKEQETKKSTKEKDEKKETGKKAKKSEL